MASAAAPLLDYCETCNKFIRASDWSRHMKTTNHANQKVRCDYCEQTFGRAAGLEKHLKRRHGQAMHQCCGQQRDPKAHSSHRWREHRSGPRVPRRPRKRPAVDIESKDVKQVKRDDDKENDPAFEPEDSTRDVSDNSDSVQDDVGNQQVPETEPEDSLQDFIPQEALAGPSAPSVSLLDDDDYEFYNEPKQVIPRKIWTDMLQYLPEQSEAMVMSRWDYLHSYINERDPVVRAYNYRLLGSEQMSAAEYFDWMYYKRIDTAFRVKASLHLLLQNKKTNEYKVFYASNNNFNLQVPGHVANNKYFLIKDDASRDEFKQALEMDAIQEALSLPGVTLKYLERGTVDFRFSLFSRKDDALYRSLRDSITGGLSVVNNRLAVVGETGIRGNDKFKTKNINGYDFNALYLAAIAKEMPMGFYVHWMLRETGAYGPYFYKQSKNKPIADEWLEYIAKSRNVTIVHAERNGYEKRIGPRQLPVDGLDEENKTVYEFKGCFWHMHDPAVCSLNKQTINSKTGATVESCQAESTDRKDYMESLGYEYEEIWECEWKRQKEDPPVEAVLSGLESKPFHDQKYLSRKKMLQAIEEDSMFGFAKVDLETPDHLKDFFNDFPPVIKNTPVTIHDVGPHMRAWCIANEQPNFKTRCLIGSYKGKDLWMLTPMIRYLMQKGVQVTKVSEVVQYDRGSPFGWFKHIVTEKRSEADAAPELQIVGEMFKSIGNNGYGKTVTALHRHVQVILVGTRELRAAINDPYLEDVKVMGEGCYEVTRRPRNKKMNLPMQIGLAVYSYAKLYMMEFAYDVLQKYCDSRLYDILESDTDSMYLMMACETFDELVLPEKRDEFAAIKSKYFVVDEKKDKRTPGLLKIEFKNGQQMVCLCAKTYAIQSKEDFKLSCKGLMKRCNDFNIEQFKNVLKTKQAGTGINVGFMQRATGIQTYVQQRSGLTYKYVKRKLLSCGLRTVPLDI